jgi:predicted metal-dependent hydrolase
MAASPALMLMIEGQAVPVTFRENARARRIILRFDKSGEGVVLTLPRRTSKTRALAFAEIHKGWIAERLARKPDRIAFADGARIPFQGREISIVHTGKVRGLAHFDGEALHVGGAVEHVSRRVRDWLKAQARAELATASQRYALAMGLKFSAIRLRDTQSRWGSCTSSGVLSYSWRLIFAPAFVLDYVCAHEVAHLQEMNHGPRFWALVAAHFPNWQAARDWLRQDGQHLHRIG